jgi:glycosyltransferase involved in cell wall biosynthesis
MQTKQKVLHFIESAGVYGAERVILNLSLQMQQTGDYIPVVGCIVDSIHSNSALYDAACAAGIEAIKIPIANARLLSDLPKAAAQLKQAHIDLIHSHGYKPSVFGFIIRLLKKIPVIATCHLWFEPSKGPLKTRVMIRLEKLFYRWFPKVIAVSEPIKDILLKSNLSAAQVGIVRNGVDIPHTNQASPMSHPLRKTLGISEHTFCVLNSARLTRQKAQWVLVKAAAILKERGESVRILIVGEGALEQELREQISAEHVNDCVELLGFRKDIDQLLAMSNAFALPSIDEGMPMSLLEAAAAAKPIISTLVGDIGKLIKHENTGLVIPTEDPAALADAILQLKNDALAAQELAEQAHAHMLQHYSSQAMCAAYLEIYQQVLTSKNTQL